MEIELDHAIVFERAFFSESDIISFYLSSDKVEFLALVDLSDIFPKNDQDFGVKYLKFTFYGLSNLDFKFKRNSFPPIQDDEKLCELASFIHFDVVDRLLDGFRPEKFLKVEFVGGNIEFSFQECSVNQIDTQDIENLSRS